MLALLSLVPLVLLYLFRPDPRKVELPTMGFLPTPVEEGAANPVVEKLRRNRLLLIQIAALVLLSLAIASPYLAVGGTEYSEHTVVVLDASASMATGDGETRFDSAVSDAAADVTGDTTVVVAGSSPEVRLREGSSAEAAAVLEGTTVKHVKSDLGSALSQAHALAGDAGRVLVYSDFSGPMDWRLSVEQARADDVPVVLNQYSDGGEGNVGFVGARVHGTTATLSVHNYGDRRAERTVSMADESQEVSIDARSRETVSFEIPAGGAVVELSPADDFPVDDTAYLAAHPDGALEVLLVTSDGGSLETALTSNPAVSVDVQTPPATSFDGDSYDVVVYHDVDVDRLVSRNARDTLEVVEAGGGAIFTAQGNLDRYGEGFSQLLPVEPDEVTDAGPVERTRGHSLVGGHDLPAPRAILAAEPVDEVHATSGGHPLVAEQGITDGRSLYLGYMTEESDFHTSYIYPLFLRDTVHYAADRETISSANRRTGDVVEAGEVTVSTPMGERSGSIRMEETGFYDTGDDLYSANLYSVEESDVSAEPVEDTAGGEAASRSQEASVPLDLTPPTAVLALAAVVAELLYLRYREDL